MRRFVVLRHCLPDGTEHFDWMIEREASLTPDDRTLVTFRTATLPCRADSFEAERIADHRSLYLQHEGVIVGGRGWVTRVAGGCADLIRLDARSAVVRLHTDEQAVCLEGTSDDAIHYRFVRAPC
ncbi:MAG: hypothetical protein Kow0022_13220 [Phycisphaerales bacterium]